MTCREFLFRITAYPSTTLQSLFLGDVKTNQDVDLLSHLSSCPTCAERLESERQFRALIKRHAPKVSAPEYLLDLVLEAIAFERASESANPRVRRTAGEPRTPGFSARSDRPAFHVPRPTSRVSPIRLFAYSLTAVGIMALVVLFTWMPWQNEAPAIFAVVDDHIRYLPEESQRQIVSSNRAGVEAWFAGQLDFAVKVPEFNSLQLLGGRRCYLFGQRVALLFYEQAGKKLSLFILEDRGLNLEGMSWRNHGDREIGAAACKGYNLVCWRQNGLAYALVSDLPRQILLDLTSQL